MCFVHLVDLSICTVDLLDRVMNRWLDFCVGTFYFYFCVHIFGIRWRQLVATNSLLQ